MHMLRIAFLLCCGLLAACGGDKTGTVGAGADDGLPKPAATTGSVTGMPDPGVADRRPAASTTGPADIVELPEALDSEGMPPADPFAAPMPIEPAPTPLPEPTMSEDPNAPPPAPPEQAETRVPADGPR